LYEIIEFYSGGLPVDFMAHIKQIKGFSIFGYTDINTVYVKYDDEGGLDWSTVIDFTAFEAETVRAGGRLGRMRVVGTKADKLADLPSSRSPACCNMAAGSAN
jgi:hypothetical protein